MELVIVLWLLYGVQCVVWAPAGGVWFVRPFARWLATEGPGWRLLHPWPSAQALRAARFPLEERDGRLLARGDTSWWTSRGVGAGAFELEASALADAAAHDARVELEGRVIARAASAPEAAALAQRLRALGEASPAARDEILRAALGERLSQERCSERIERAHAGTRWLGHVCDVYFVVGLLLLPFAILRIGSERALTLGLPLLALLHVLALLLYARAHRRVRPSETGALAEELLAAALYPPLLLRARHELATWAIGTFHPASVAAVALPEEERDAVLRRELVRARRDAASDASPLGIAARELELLRELAQQLGAPEATLLAPPQRSDPHALAYCPDCRSEYRRADGECVECRVPLAPLPEA